MSVFRMTEAQLAARLAKNKPAPKVPRTLASLVIPWPPTVNHSTRPDGKGGRLLTAAHKQFRADVAAIVVDCGLHLEPLAGRLKVTIHASPPDKRARDLDNLQKAILDAIQHAGVYADDAAIDDLRIMRFAGVPGTCAVFIEVIK